MPEIENKDKVTRYFSGCACHPRFSVFTDRESDPHAIEGRKSVAEFYCTEMQDDALTKRVTASFVEFKL